MDAAALEQGYREIQAQIHPDRFAASGDAERRASMQWTTRVNEAYQTLSNAEKIEEMSRLRRIMRRAYFPAPTRRASAELKPAPIETSQPKPRPSLSERSACSPEMVFRHGAENLRTSAFSL